MSTPAVADRPLHPATLVIAFARNLPQLVLGLPAVAYFIGDAPIGIAVAIAAAGLVISMAVAWLVWARFRYGAGDEEFVIESGVLSRNRRTISYARVQDVSITRPLLARLLGVAQVAIETGSGEKNEGLLDCVSLAEAGRLRDLIRHRKAGARCEGEASDTLDTNAEEPALFAMTAGRLLLAGLFNFSLVFLAVLGGLAQNFGDWLPFDFYDPRRFVGEKQVAMAQDALLAWPVIAAGALGIVGLVAGIARTVVRDYGFKLTRTATGLRRQRGLFTRTDVVIPLRRVQAAIFTTGPVRRLFGWRALALQSLGDDGKEGQNHLVVPLGKPAECAVVLGPIALPLLPAPAKFRRVSLRFAIRRAALYSLALAMIAIPLILVAGPFWLLASALVPAMGIAWLQWRHHGWLLAERHLFIRQGFWRQRGVALECAKIQSLSLTRGPVQRVLGLATLLVATAGAPALAPIRIVDMELRDARRLRDALLPRARGRWL